MSKVFVAVVCFLVLFTSCASKDFGYNEKTASNFLLVMNKVDETHEKLAKGGYTPGKEPEQFRSSVTGEADNAIEFVEQIEANMKELSHSSKADPFHARVVKYLNDVKTGYFGTLRIYLLEKDSANQKAIYQKLMDTRKQLGDDENKTLEAQKQFLKEAGLG